MTISTIEWANNKIRIIDQTKLPLNFKYMDCRNVSEVCVAIKKLKVRGAPAIGIAGALGVALGARNIKEGSSDIFIKKVVKIIDYLASSRPTAVNLFWALERMKAQLFRLSHLRVYEIKRRLLLEALEILKEDKDTCRKMANFGSRLIKNNKSYLTICNAGALATADYGTALGVFYRAKEKGKNFKVFACETRPLLQGARLTTWELKKHGIDTILIADNTAASLMSQEIIDAVFVGADRISSCGDTANKIGTSNLAITSYYHKIPFYVVSPSTTFDLSLESGDDIPIEHRNDTEVLKLLGKDIAPSGVKAYNPAFDVTPSKFITAFITEKGIVYPPFKQKLKKIIGNK